MMAGMWVVEMRSMMIVEPLHHLMRCRLLRFRSLLQYMQVQDVWGGCMGVHR